MSLEQILNGKKRGIHLENKPSRWYSFIRKINRLDGKVMYI